MQFIFLFCNTYTDCFTRSSCVRLFVLQFTSQKKPYQVMKKIILIAAGVILTVSGFAQIKLGLQVTGTLASADVKSKYDINFDKGIAGLPGVSAIVQYDISRHMSLRTGVTYLQQGTE